MEASLFSLIQSNRFIPKCATMNTSCSSACSRAKQPYDNRKCSLRLHIVHFLQMHLFCPFPTFSLILKNTPWDYNVSIS